MTQQWEKVNPEYQGNIMNIYITNQPSFVTMLNYSSEEEVLDEPVGATDQQQDILFSLSEE